MTIELHLSEMDEAERSKKMVWPFDKFSNRQCCPFTCLRQYYPLGFPQLVRFWRKKKELNQVCNTNLNGVGSFQRLAEGISKILPQSLQEVVWSFLRVPLVQRKVLVLPTDLTSHLSSFFNWSNANKLGYNYVVPTTLTDTVVTDINSQPETILSCTDSNSCFGEFNVDMSQFKNGSYIGDEAINIFLRLLRHRYTNIPLAVGILERRSTWVYNTFFFEKILSWFAKLQKGKKENNSDKNVHINKKSCVHQEE